MKLLFIHSDFIEYEPKKKALKTAEDVSKKKVRVKDCLVVFTAAEKDDKNETIKNAVDNVKDVAKQVKAKNIVLYPFVHISQKPASPHDALSLMKKMEHELKGYKVKRAPFGWYKSFDIRCKGHPLAELSRDIGTAKRVKKIIRIQKIILDRKGLPVNDHRILGEDLGLFHFSDEVGAGLPLWLPRGEIIRNELEKFMREIEERYGYKYVHTPDITKGSLYESSGHLPYYKESMYNPVDIDGVDYYLRPMNCPHHHMIFKKIVKSYRDLPLRLAEAGTTYRNELSGVMYGLIRVRCFTQNDAHIYVTPEQLKQEFIRVINLFQDVYKVTKVKNYWFKLSLPDFKENPDKYTGDEKEWEHASQEIRKAMKEVGVKFVEEKGEAAFYGPKIDIQIKNTLGKEETIATSQVDIVVPKRMNLTYVDKDEKKKNIIIIHRAILGSFERFIAYLLEQTKGVLPVWLSPVQVRVLSFTQRNTDSVKKLVEEFKTRGIRAEEDICDNTVDYKVRGAESLKIPYVIVLGDKEEENKTLAVRERGSNKVAFGVKKEDFIERVLKQIKNRE